MAYVLEEITDEIREKILTELDKYDPSQFASKGYQRVLRRSLRMAKRAIDHDTGNCLINAGKTEPGGLVFIYYFYFRDSFYKLLLNWVGKNIELEKYPFGNLKEMIQKEILEAFTVFGMVGNGSSDFTSRLKFDLNKE